jgi:hypothetical protein
MGLLDEFVVVLLALLVALGIWWASTRARRSTVDWPGQLLAAAVRRLPADRRDWGAAMTAELAQLRDPWARRRFALGCARVALFPPRGARPLAVVGVLAVVVAVASGWSVGRAAPELQLFAVTFTGLVGALALLTVARSRKPRLTAAGLAITVGVAGCVAAVGYVAVIEPAGARGSLDDLSVVLALLLTGYLWVALTPPRGLVAAPLPRRLGVGAGIALGLDLAAVSMVDYDFDHAAVPYAWSAALVIVLACSVVAGAVRGSSRAGAETALWAGLIGTLAFFAVETLAALHRFRTGDPRFLDDARVATGASNLDAFVPAAVTEHLSGVIVTLALLPAIVLLLGLIGGAVGSSMRRVLRRPDSTGPVAGIVAL